MPEKMSHVHLARFETCGFFGDLEKFRALERVALTKYAFVMTRKNRRVNEKRGMWALT
jgi:hypothetical protein